MEVIPHAEAIPTDTFSLMVSDGESTTTLAEDTPIADLAEDPYVFESEPTPTPNELPV